MFGLSGLGSLLNLNPLGSITGTSTSLLSMMTGSLGEEGSALQNIAGIMQNFFSGHEDKIRIKDIQTQTRMYGKMIPELFGKMRIAGNIIWHSKIVTTTIQNPPQMSKTGQVSGGGTAQTCRASFAIALGKGVIDGVDAIYANEVSMNLSTINYVVYNGDEDQMPNSTIQAYLGAGNVPAFRGLAYVVFTDFPLENYSNSIPNLTFDVRRTSFVSTALADKIKPENMIAGINIIPGSGESVYDTVVQSKHQMIAQSDYFGAIRVVKANFGKTINKNTAQPDSDFVVSVTQMKQTLPNLKWVSLVVTWFADSLDISTANIYPAHEGYGYETFPDNWQVAGLSRKNCKTVSMVNGSLNYGGTVSDIAVIRAINHLKDAGYKVCLYPMIFVDTPDKPWRGRMTGNAEDINNFFIKQNGYNNFISHYANLAKGLVDAFIIGSEMIGLTSINYNNTFPAVTAFAKLATAVKNVMGQTTKITYAADWSEYHHTDGGWFNMDALWSSPDIDFIGIDAYFPLTNSTQNITDPAIIAQGWNSGEGWDFYYKEQEKITKEELDSQYAWKNIEYFWKNNHVNPNGRKTAWVPQSKPIWFTEYGFPSIDCATNQPNVFFNPTSIDSGIPLHSKGNMNLQTQRAAIAATEQFWQNSEFVVQKNIWTWDARPYPAFPALATYWSDSPTWQYGHFLNGKLGSVGSLGDIIKYLCIEAGIYPDFIDTTDLQANVLGFYIDSKVPAIQHIATLAKVYNFDGYNNGGKFVFTMRSNARYHQIDESDILINKNGQEIIITKDCDNIKNSGAIELLYVNPNNAYRINTAAFVVDLNTGTKVTKNTYKIPLALTQSDAVKAAFNIGFNNKLNQTKYNLQLSIKYADILPNDVIELTYQDQIHLIRVNTITILDITSIAIDGISASDEFVSTINIQESPAVPMPDNIAEIVPTNLTILDINNIDNANDSNCITLYCAVNGTLLDKKWTGCQLFVSNDSGKSYNFVQTITNQSVVGQVIQPLQGSVNPNQIDYKSVMTVIFKDLPNIQSISLDELLQYNNLVLVGNEIVAFKNVTIQNGNTVNFDTFLRGRYGTESFIDSSFDADRFILLNKSMLTKLSIPLSAVGQTLYFKAVSFNDSIYNTDPIMVNIVGNSNKDFTPSITNSTKDGNNNFNITFVPRPLYENSFYNDGVMQDFKYNVIMKNQLGKPISKINACNLQNVTYSQANQITDFGTVQSSINYQIVGSVT